MLYMLKGKAPTVACLLAALFCGSSTEPAMGVSAGLDIHVWTARHCTGQMTAKVANAAMAQMLCANGYGVSYYDPSNGCSNYP